MSATMTLSQLADLALGSPEVGAVNFNVMHTLFHAMLAKLNIGDVKAEISKEDKEFLASRKPEDVDGADGFSDKDSAITGMTDTTDRTDRPNTRDSKDFIPYKRTPYHELENKIGKMQEQIDRFNSLPTNEELKKIVSQGDGEVNRPVSDMWQAMQIKNRVDANEEGVSKLMSLVDELLKDVLKLKDENGELKKQLEDTNKLSDMLDRLKALEDLTKDLKDKQNAMGDKLDQYPDDFSDFVTWQGLEDALKGVKEELAPKDRVVIEMGQQTAPASLPNLPGKLQPRMLSTPHSSRAPSRRNSTPGPSLELLEILERLGILTEKHDKLEDRVDKIEEELKNKADKGDLDGLGGVPDDLLDRLDKFADEIEELKKVRDRAKALTRRVKDLEKLQGIQQPSGTSTSSRPDSSGANSGADSPDALGSDIAESLIERVDKLESNVKQVDGRLDNTTEQLDVQIRELQDLVADIPSQFGANIILEESPSKLSAAERYGMDHFPRSNVIQVGSHQGGSKPLVYNKSGILTVGSRNSNLLLESPSDQDMGARASHHTRLGHNAGGHYAAHPPHRSHPPIISSYTNDGSPQYSAMEQILHKSGLDNSDSPTQAQIIGYNEDGTPQYAQPFSGSGTGGASGQAGGRGASGTPVIGTPVIVGYNADGTPQYRSGDDSGMCEDGTSNDEAGSDGRGRRGYRSRNKFGKQYGKKTGGADDNEGGISRRGSHAGLGAGGSYSGVGGDNDGEMVDRETFDAFVAQNDEQIMGLQKKIETLKLGMGLIESQGKLKALDGRLSNTMDVLKGFNLPEDGQDNDALSRLHQALFNLQTELERVSKHCQHLIDENGNRIKDIDGLFTLCKELDENKADKEWTQNRLDVKADKKQLEHKVNRSLFDETCDELNKMINDVLSNLKECEDEWKKALAQMTEDLDGKLDRLEFGPIRDEIERQLRALMRKINSLNVQADLDDDAAGIRKQLVQRFHCISCDRPVDMMPHGVSHNCPIPSIPQPSGLPANRSARPYTTFELDQIRQHAKRRSPSPPYARDSRSSPHRRRKDRCKSAVEGKGTYDFAVDMGVNQHPPTMGTTEVTELYNNRACGGSHTMTFPHRRVTRASHANGMFRDDEVQPTKEELDVQGADGHIYKGRLDKLPNLQQGGKSSPKLGRRARTEMHQAADPAPPMSPRPSSARLSRPNTAGSPPQQVNSSPRPSSANMQVMDAVGPVPSAEFVPEEQHEHAAPLAEEEAQQMEQAVEG